ncbi:PHA/PHB synthase family protein [Roseomonas xinghualingensis]|uniref:PHA/PHB synthase family protein n=1 Tax=Roseomonas xinghualingensis TaxID=2986475 RepID=UPI0021F151C0|nr:class I poly(R)-hydroxyalkanoic acid synthase [Roseomonas sp. SXEYE001]MCV4206322.1 class I poly(R)-hydroxyalkanoic acid synthase [Roseomonas sp. SXEYE001]
MLGDTGGEITNQIARDPVLRSIDRMWNANPLRDIVPVDWAEVARALRVVWLRNLHRPADTLMSATRLNTNLWHSAFETWSQAGQHWLGTSHSSAAGSANRSSDKRFTAPEWNSNPIYRSVKEAYLLASDWLLQQSKADDLDEAEQQWLTFHLRQFVDAMSPSLLLFSNPAALRRAMETGGASLADGARNLLNDLQAGRLSLVDTEAFAPGRNLALSPGKVVHRNKLIELIQYAPVREDVHKTPLLILPPWINKYYILDLQPRNSMVRYLAEQGFTVFMVSWKNPDASMDGTTIEDYMNLGPLAASDVIRDITGSPSVNVMGYCIGGTLLAMTLARLAAQGDDRFNSATFMVSLQDFSRVGDTAVFMGDDSLDLIEQQMMERGYLDSREMSNMFNLLRSNDLIWSNVVNNYLMGEKPPAFDLLYWNSDGTRMCRAAHSWYLRNMYRENNLVVPERIKLHGEAIDLGRIKQDIYAVGAERDHIVPWDAAWRITQLVGGKVRYVLASSGHIAGIINPPGGKGTYWTQAEEAPTASSAEEWLRNAERHDDSWWTDWNTWLGKHSGPMIPPPSMGSAAHPPLDDAPGRYVLEK